MTHSNTSLLNLVTSFLNDKKALTQYITQKMVFRLRVVQGENDEPAIEICGFRPTANGESVDSFADFRQNQTLWMGYPRHIFQDFVPGDDDEDTLKPLHQKFRDNKYDVFYFNPDDAEITLTIKASLLEEIYTATHLAAA